MIRPLTVAGAAQAGPTMFGGTSLLPVELRYVNHTASTNGAILRAFQVHPLYNRWQYGRSFHHRPDRRTR